MKYLVSFGIPEDLREEIYTFRKQLGHLITNLPHDLHTTLMSFRAQERNERALIQSLEEISHSSFFVEGRNELEVYDEGALVVRLKRTSEIHDLHHEVIESVAPYLDWDNINPIPKKYINDSRRREVYQRYGSVYCAELYHPHISLCNVDDSKVGSSARSPFTVLFEVEEFKLSKKQTACGLM